MRPEPTHSPLEVLAYSLAILAMFTVIDTQPKESPLWWGSLALVCLALLAINYRYRVLCARLRELEPSDRQGE